MGKIAVVCEPPNAEAHRSGRAMSAAAEQVFAQAVRKVGFTKDDFVFVPLCEPVPQQYRNNKKLEWGCVEPHVARVKADLERVKPDCVLTLGNLAARAVLDRQVKITEARGALVEHEGRRVMPLYGPGMVLAAPQYAPALQTDLASLKRLLDAGWDQAAAEKSLGEYRWVDDLQFLIDLAPKVIAFDTENWNADKVRGSALRWQHPLTRCLMVQISWAAGKAVAVPIDLWEKVFPGSNKRAKVFEQLKQILGDPGIRKIGQNVNYDCLILRKVLGIRVRGVTHDTLLLSHCVDEDMPRRNMDDLVRRFVPEMAGYADCVAPWTRILRADLTWAPATEVRAGDELVGFDETSSGRASRRKMRVATVQSVVRRTKPRLRITTSTGRVLTVSTNHQMLTKKYQSSHMWTWRRADELVVGMRFKGFPMRDRAEDFDSGWLSGIYDGEGYVTKHGASGLRLGFSQAAGAVLDRGVRLLGDEGYRTLAVSESQGGRLSNVTLTGWDAHDALQRFAPGRLIAKRTWEGKCLPTRAEQETIVSIEDAGYGEVVSIQTSTATFIAEGLCSHNCFNREVDELYGGKGNMERVPPEKLLAYGCGDADANFRLCAVLAKMVRRDNAQWQAYKRTSMPGLLAFQEAQWTGMRACKAELRKFGKLIAEEAETEYRWLVANAPAAIKRRHLEQAVEKMLDAKEKAKAANKTEKGRFFDRDAEREKVRIDEREVLKFTRHDFIRDIMFDPEGFGFQATVYTKSTQDLFDEEEEWDDRVASTSAKLHMPYFFGHPRGGEYIRRLSSYQKLSKLLTTYIGEEICEKKGKHFGRPTGLWKYIGEDEFIHPVYTLWGTNCVTADTLFLTSRGYLPYSSLRVGDTVLSHTGTPRKVVDLIENGVKPVYRVTLADGTSLDCTANHPFRSADGEWVACADLEVGREIVTYGGAEQWREVEGWPYQVSSWGRVRSSAGHILTPQPKGAWGHLKVLLVRDSARVRGEDRKDFAIHRLVAEAFVTNPGGLPEVRHLNGLAWDNTAANLAWGTVLENRRDAVAHGTMDRTNGAQSKLTWEQVDAMRASGLGYRRAAKAFGVSESLCKMILKGERWVRKECRREVCFDTAAVVSVEYLGELPTFSPEIEVDHSHVSNGIVTHNTGRTNSRDPNGQNFPSRGPLAKAYMKVFKAPPGWKVVAADLSQIELRIVAWLARDPVMLQIYRTGGDIHTYTAKKVMGLSDAQWDALPKAEKKLARTKAKAVNFGFVYGMSWRKFLAYAFTDYGVTYTEAEAERTRINYFKTYPRLEAWHNEVREAARIHKAVRAPHGAVRHLPGIVTANDNTLGEAEREVARGKRAEAERQAINAPVQRLGSDIGVSAARRIVAQLRAAGITWLRFCAFVHDALYFYVREGHELEAVNAIVYAMETVPLERWYGKQARPPIPIVAEPDVGISFSEKVELGDVKGQTMEEIEAAYAKDGGEAPQWFRDLMATQPMTSYDGGKPSWWRDDLDDMAEESMWVEPGVPLAA